MEKLIHTNLPQPLTVLSFGAGQDSTYILYKYILDKEYRKELAPGDFMVVMSDTGDEHKATYQHVRFVRELCHSHGVEFHFITADMGYHPRTWPDLVSQLKRNNTIMSIAMPRSCTDNLKIKPFYNFLNVYIGRKYCGQQLDSSTRNKTWIKRYFKDYGKLRVILGIAKGEESRIKSPCTKCQSQLNLFPELPEVPRGWMNICVEKLYPLIEKGVDRMAAQAFINTTGWPLPPPSNCQRCPFIGKPELIWLHLFEREIFNEWVALENAKLERCRHLKRNLGVKGDKTLEEVLAEAYQQYAHWSTEQLQEYKMSHGHGVTSSY